MTRKIIGTALIVAALVLSLLIISGGTIVPHIVGPIVLAIVGVAVLTHGGRAVPSTK